MKIGILQPGYLPWLGFFDQMNRCDTFVIYDDVQYTKRDWRSRNRIKTPDAIQWLTVPVSSKSKREQLVNEAKIVNDRKWNYKHIRTIEKSYSKAKYFEQYYPTLKNILESEYEYLISLDMDLIDYLRTQLNINTEVVCSSSMEAKDRGTRRLVNICQELGGTDYLTGDAAKDYLDVQLFVEYNIRVEYHNYNHPYYSQLWVKEQGFISHLSVIDLLFNHGPESVAILTGKRVIASPENVKVRHANEV